MALGQTYNNNKQKEFYRPTVYGYSMSNTAESAVDSTNLSFSMWKGTIKLAIAPGVKNDNQDGAMQFDRENAAAIYLSHSKAYMFAEVLKNFMKDPKTYNGYGVYAGAGLITISDGKEYEANGPCLVIRKINKDTANVEASYAYEFKRDYHKVIEHFDEESKDFSENADMFSNLELLQVIAQLEDYARAMNNAIAFAVCDNMAFQQHYLTDSLGKIAAKLGVQLSGGQKSSSGSYFNKKSSESSSSARQTGTIDDIMAE